MRPSDADRKHCGRCGATISPGSVVCGLCGEAQPGAKGSEPAEPWLLPPQESHENPYKASEALEVPPSSALGVLLRIFLTGLGIGLVALSIIIAFFSVCFAVGIQYENLLLALLAGLVAAVFIGFLAIRAFRWVRSKFKSPRTDA